MSCHGDQDNTVPYLCGEPLSGAISIELCGGGAILDHTTAISFEKHFHQLYEGAGHVPWEFGGSSEETMISFVSEHLYNNLHCANVGAEELVREKPLIFPNPTESKFTIKSLKRIYNVVISNLKGVVIFRSNNPSEVDITHLPKGIYMIETQDEDQKTSRTKVVKM